MLSVNLWELQTLNLASSLSSSFIYNHRPLVMCPSARHIAVRILIDSGLNEHLATGNERSCQIAMRYTLQTAHLYVPRVKKKVPKCNVMACRLYMCVSACMCVSVCVRDK